MSKLSSIFLPIEEVDFNKLKFTEIKGNEKSKYQDVGFANYELPDGSSAILYFKSPILKYSKYSLPSLTDQEGAKIEYKNENKDRAKWRCYMGESEDEQKMLQKFQELQAKLIKDKTIIVGKKDEKKYELEPLISEAKDGESYVRFVFSYDTPKDEISTKFFIRNDGNDEAVPIKTVSDFESMFRRGEISYRFFGKINKIYKDKKMPGKYGIQFAITQMLIEKINDSSSMTEANLFSKSQFGDDKVKNIIKKLDTIDISKHIEASDDEDEDDAHNQLQSTTKNTKDEVQPINI